MKHFHKTNTSHWITSYVFTEETKQLLIEDFGPEVFEENCNYAE